MVITKIWFAGPKSRSANNYLQRPDLQGGFCIDSIQNKLGGALRDLQFYYGICACFDVCRIWQLGVFGRMGNTPTGRADDLPTILGISKNELKSRSVNNSLQRLDLDPNSRKKCLPDKAPPCVDPIQNENDNQTSLSKLIWTLQKKILGITQPGDYSTWLNHFPPFLANVPSAFVKSFT